MAKPMTISVSTRGEDSNIGDIFYGDINQFRKSFFKNASRETILAWALKEKYDVEFIEDWNEETFEDDQFFTGLDYPD